jgi:hypothetical protein
MDRWNSLSAEQQDLIQTRLAEDFEAPVWAEAANALANDVACLTGTGDCASGEARDMVLVEVSEADMARAREVLETRVLPDWAERAGDDWVARWNDSVGAAVGVTVN